MAPPHSENSHPIDARFLDPEPAVEAVEEEALMPASRVRDDSEMDITPMIDMTFLLLIFFVVCSRMDPGSAVSLPPARHGETLATDNAVVFTVSVNGDETLIFRGKGEDLANLLQGATPGEREMEVARYVEERVGQNPSITDVVIMAEAGVKHRDVALVMKAAAAAQTAGNQLHVAVMEMP
jgi:biopolymer transport protein ExbD